MILIVEMGKESAGKRPWGMDTSQLCWSRKFVKEGKLWQYDTGFQMRLNIWQAGGMTHHQEWMQGRNSSTGVYNRLKHNDLNAYTNFNL